MQTNSYFKISPAIGLAVILTAGILHAEVRSAEYGTQSKPGITQTSTGTHEMRSVQRASDLLDMLVTSRDGKMSGKVEEIVLSSDNRDIEYVEISLKDSVDRITVPTKELSVTADGTMLSLALSQADMQRRIQSTAEMNRNQQLGKTIPDSRRVSELMGKEVRGSDGEKIGSINDLLIDMDQGRVTTAALETGGVMGVGSKFASVDWPSVQFQSSRDYATVNQTQQQLQNSATSQQEYWQRFGFEGEDEKDNGMMKQPGDNSLKWKQDKDLKNQPSEQKSRTQQQSF